MSTPLHELVRVVHGNGDFSSKLVTLVDVQPGAVLTKIEGTRPASERAYTSVQVSEDSDIELESNLVYCNHACSPSVVFDMEKAEVRAVEHKPLKKGEDVTFFYPSTEWDMQQPFQCQCGGKNCLGLVSGAKDLGDGILERYWLNPHIRRLLATRKNGSDSGEANGKMVDSVMEPSS